MTPNVRDYTTEELERLTTLSEQTAKPGEFCRRFNITTLRLSDDRQAYKSGSVYVSLGHPLERRVRSFTDATEIDPPQAEMLAELARRKQPQPRFKVGDVIQNLYGRGYEKARKVGSVIPNPKPKASFVYRDERGRYIAYESCAVEPTDAELAAYHREHCVAVPSPAPVVVSNREHGGRRVQFGAGTGIVASPHDVPALCRGYSSTAGDNDVWWFDDCGVVRLCDANRLTLLP